MFVKVCGTTSEEDALLAVAVGADAVGFVLAPSPRQVAVERVRDIVARLPPDVLTVGVFRDAAPEQVVEMVHRGRLKAAQLHGRERPEDTQYVHERVPIVFKAFTAGDPAVRTAADHAADAVNIDGARPGSGQVFDWTLTEAAVRAGQRDMALSLAYERLGLRPGSAPNRRFLSGAEAIAA